MSKTQVALFLGGDTHRSPTLGFGWGREGHEVVALIAGQNMSPAALKRARAILGGASLEQVANWADEYQHDHRETGPWHYIDIPLSDSKIDMAHDCPNRQCVTAHTEHFLSVLKDPNAAPATKAEALKFVIHFVGDLHQPLHDEDDGDKGGNDRHFARCSAWRPTFYPARKDSEAPPAML